MEKALQVNCDFCGRGMECPPDMLKTAKKHMCHECFYDRAEKGGDEHEALENAHVDIPTDELIPKIASEMTDSIVNEIFPDVWEEKKHELKEMSKKEMAYEMFGAGAYIALSNFMETQRRHESKDESKRETRTD